MLFTTLVATAQVGDIDAPMSCRIVIKGDDSTAACAAEPVVFAKFDTDPGFDLSSLTAGNFYDVIITMAKQEGWLRCKPLVYRPHPGRRHAAAAMTLLYMASVLVTPDSGVSAWLALAAGAAFLDRLAEWFIGQPAFKTEVAVLAFGNAFAGAGFLVLGATRLGLDLPPVAGLHMLSVGALGCAVMAVLIIAGLRHTGRDLLDLPWQAHGAALLIAAAAFVRVLPEIAFASGLAPLLWSLPTGR